MCCIFISHDQSETVLCGNYAIRAEQKIFIH